MPATKKKACRSCKKVYKSGRPYDKDGECVSCVKVAAFMTEGNMQAILAFFNLPSCEGCGDRHKNYEKMLCVPCTDFDGNVEVSAIFESALSGAAHRRGASNSTTAALARAPPKSKSLLIGKAARPGYTATASKASTSSGSSRTGPVDGSASSSEPTECVIALTFTDVPIAGRVSSKSTTQLFVSDTHAVKMTAILRNALEAFLADQCMADLTEKGRTIEDATVTLADCAVYLYRSQQNKHAVPLAWLDLPVKAVFDELLTREAVLATELLVTAKKKNLKRVHGKYEPRLDIRLIFKNGAYSARVERALDRREEVDLTPSSDSEIEDDTCGSTVAQEASATVTEEANPAEAGPSGLSKGKGKEKEVEPSSLPAIPKRKREPDFLGSDADPPSERSVVRRRLNLALPACSFSSSWSVPNRRRLEGRLLAVKGRNFARLVVQQSAAVYEDLTSASGYTASSGLWNTTQASTLAGDTPLHLTLHQFDRCGPGAPDTDLAEKAVLFLPSAMYFEMADPSSEGETVTHFFDRETKLRSFEAVHPTTYRVERALPPHVTVRTRYASGAASVYSGTVFDFATPLGDFLNALFHFAWTRNVEEQVALTQLSAYRDGLFVHITGCDVKTGLWTEGPGENLLLLQPE
ncbi:hypothetical protein Rhopal_000193-T1 [Rhodotorula paludigena]|uniref:Uncharacterized protein n=1 Tax=Rhodotorula paludigena TaxID=86838 RepID=A0AAV5GF38_9BASI|nr:hypothetical protein Rhopal_000193-T1 [Rhodotorula paludigena]